MPKQTCLSPPEQCDKEDHATRAISGEDGRCGVLGSALGADQAALPKSGPGLESARCR